MVQLYIQIPGSPDPCPEWAIVELQGDLESRKAESLQGKLIGDLHFTTKGVPVLIIGHHILYGKVVKLEKPLIVISRTAPQLNDSDAVEEKVDEKEHNDIDYEVKSVIKKKLVFKTRPKPIIANVPKKI